MRKHAITKLSIAMLITYSVFATGINILLLGTTDRTFFPTANFFIVALVWLSRSFDSLFSLAMGLILYFSLIICFIRIMLRKPVRTLVISIYILDVTGVLYLLVNRQGLEHTVSLIMDICVILLSSKMQVSEDANDSSIYGA